MHLLMFCRLLVVAMHFNKNFCRAKVTTTSGAERIKITLPKQKHGEFTPKIVSVLKNCSKQNYHIAICTTHYIIPLYT